MTYSIKKHEVDRLMNVLIPLGWVLEKEYFESKGIIVIIHKQLSDELLKAAGEIEGLGSPK